MFLLGDSIIKGIEQHRVRKNLHNNEKVHVKYFSGATTNHMHSMPNYQKSSTTTSLSSTVVPTILEIAKEIMELASEMKLNKNEVMVSGIVQRRDKLNDKGNEVSKLLQSSCISKNFYFIDNSNINHEYHLNSSGLHLNTRGTYTLGNNFVHANTINDITQTTRAKRVALLIVL